MTTSQWCEADWQGLWNDDDWEAHFLAAEHDSYFEEWAHVLDEEDELAYYQEAYERSLYGRS